MKAVRPDLTVVMPPSAPNAMEHQRKRRVLRSGALLAAGSMLALVCAAAVDFEPWPEPDPENASCCGQSSRVNFEPWPEPELTADEAVLSAATGGSHRAGADELDPLRNSAALGDADSAVRLAQELVDRFETRSGKDDLFEAVLWIDRYHGTETLARSGVIARVAAKHCNQKILHFHWMCTVGE